ncbi:MAG: hypothetical protein WBV85_00690 [Solirubrobacteraceae bacterium]
MSLRRTRTWRGAHTAAPLALALGCLLIVIAGFASDASASNTEMRGEWEIVLKAGTQTNSGTIVIRQEAGPKGEFTSNAFQPQEGSPSTFMGTLEGATAKVKITTTASNSIAAGEFASEAMTVTSGVGTLEISGEGLFSVGEALIPATATATRIKTYPEVLAREQAEAEAEAKHEQEAQEAQEAQEKAEREAKEKAERETKERREREVREEVENINKIALQPPSSLPLAAPPVPVVIATKTLTVPNSGAVSLKLTNPNGSPATGQLKVTSTIRLASSKHRGHAKSKTITLGKASFSLAGNGTGTVKIVLSHSARSELSQLKTMHALIALITETDGKQAAAATYKLTLSAPAHRKG